MNGAILLLRKDLFKLRKHLQYINSGPKKFAFIELFFILKCYLFPLRNLPGPPNNIDWWKRETPHDEGFQTSLQQTYEVVWMKSHSFM